MVWSLDILSQRRGSVMVKLLIFGWDIDVGDEFVWMDGWEGGVFFVVIELLGELVVVWCLLLSSEVGIVVFLLWLDLV